MLAFARSRHIAAADADDLVQETFVQFLRGLPTFRAEASLETYLFVILRRRIVEFFRGRRLNACSLQDAAAQGDDSAGPAVDMARAPDATASTYARRDEARSAARAALSAALRDLLDGFKDSASPDFRDLQIVEMLCYAQQRNKDIGREMGLDEKYIALVKHRWLKQLRERVGHALRRELPALGDEPPGDDVSVEDAPEPEQAGSELARGTESEHGD